MRHHQTRRQAQQATILLLFMWGMILPTLAYQEVTPPEPPSYKQSQVGRTTFT